MAKRKPKQVLYRRKQEQKTNYKKRLHLLLSQKQRVVVRFTNKKIIAQIVTFNTGGDRVTVGLDSSTLKKLGWPYSEKNLPAAYLTGLLLGRRAQEKGCKEVILATGWRAPLKKGKLFAFVKGVVDTGVKMPHGDKVIFPEESRIKGEHLKEGQAQTFEMVKKKIMEK